VEPAVRIVIEDADGVLRVTASHPIHLLLLRYDDLLAEPRPVECDAGVNPRRVERLFRIHEEEAEDRD
jgi:hypothetical protein